MRSLQSAGMRVLTESQPGVRENEAVDSDA